MYEINAKEAKEAKENCKDRLEQIFKDIKSASERGYSYIIVCDMDVSYESKFLSLGFQVSRHMLPDGIETTKIKWS